MSRLRLSRRRRWIRPLLKRHRLQGAESFRASSPTSRYGVRSETPHSQQQSSDPPSRAPKRPSVRTSKGKDQTSRLPRNSSFSSDENAPLAERLSTKSHRTSRVQSDDGAGASPRVATTAQSQAVGDFGGLAMSAKAKRSEEIAIYRDDARAKPLPNDQRSAIGTDFSDHASFEGRRSVTSRSKANHHGPLRLRR